jgi:hypothetical protein
VTDLYNENYKSLKKEKEEDIRWKDFPFQRTGRINIVKVTILPKAIYMLECNPLQNSNDIPHGD